MLVVTYWSIGTKQKTMWTGPPDTADDVHSSTSTSGHSTPWSSSLQRSRARRRLNDLEKDDDDDETTPTPGRDFEWLEPGEYRSRVRRRRPPSREGRRSPRFDDRRSMADWNDARVVAMMAAAQTWAAATGCCGGGHGPCGHGPCGLPLAYRTYPAGQPPRKNCCCNSWPSGVPQAYNPGQYCGEQPCQSWGTPPRCKSTSPGEYTSLQDKISHLESDKENLALQVSVLTDQLDVQKDKLAEQEASLAEKTQLLQKTEQLLKQEMQLKKKIESDRLTLMTDIPALKLKLVTSEREKSELESKVKKLETDIVILRSCLAERETELITRGGRVPHHGSISSVPDTSHISPTKFGLGLDFLPSQNGSRERTPQSDRESRVTEKPPVYPRCSSASLPSSSTNPTYRPHTPSRSHLERTNSDDNVQGAPGSNSSSTLPRNYHHGQQMMRDMQQRQLAESQASLPEPGLRSRKGSTGVSFAQPELVIIHPGQQTLTPGSTPSPVKHGKHKGIRKIFGRLRRSNSHTMDITDSFRRGGLRATAGPRLGWVPNFNATSLFTEKPLSLWNADLIAAWVDSLGMSMYHDPSRPYFKDGNKLAKVTASELEKDLGMKHPLHRKKMLLAIESLKPEATELSRAASLLDWQWVLRWLDDIGLPQYKDTFADAMVDGRVLNALTVDDLVHMKVTSNFHHVSMKRGIQVLRLNRFDPACLKRRSLPEESKNYSPLDVSLWTNHRVMEWLRTVDLSEYAPNLRGSGVHGALLIYEDGVTCDLFAAILSIPTSKTLLRRHLSLQLKQLLGPRIMHRKRACEASPSHVPLSPSAKIKVAKKAQFSLRWRKPKSGDTSAYVCPFVMDSSIEDMSSDLSTAESSLDDSFSSKEKDSKTAQEIEAVSNEISSFMKLQEVKDLDSLTSTNI
ncbi:liprin-beta-1-like isoform X2 [Ornithodoros turicata]|uniref:liprin-beta-1-like isoform X2 n=1 Tax=Ornithodoros turicata TaxID=34597 RepID=UPI003139092E